MLSTSFRLDRALSVGMLRPTLRRLPPRPRVRVAILMYHSIGSVLDSSRAPYYRTTTSPEVFARHLSLFSTPPYQVISLAQAVDSMRGRSAVPEGRIPIVITFDDGLRDFYTNALPMLQSAGMPATVFLTTGCINGDFPTGQECLREEEVRDLARLGIELGSHTVSHPRLVEQTPAQLEQELSESKRYIEDLTGKKVAFFSYPYRFPDERKHFKGMLRSCLLANDYRAGVTTVIGRATAGSDPLFLPRLPANDADDDALMDAKLRGAYDWLAPVQSVWKMSRYVVCEAQRRFRSR